jgi:HAD superfamily phosphatase (TIGR01668 family)
MLREKGYKLVILSNNNKNRVGAFAAIFPLDYIYRGAKPLKKSFLRASKLLELERNQIVVVGDQLFTDVLGARLSRMKAVLVQPIKSETHFFLAFKRMLERPFLKGLKMITEDLE